MEKPLVSVVIPTYNYRHYITEAIESVLQQTYLLSQIEIIIIDDGSTDGTQEALQPLIETKAIRYYYQANKGKANATSQGVAKSNGKYIFNLDADDYFFKDKIERTVAVFEAYPDVAHVATPAQFVNQDKVVTYTEQIPEDILEKPLDGKWLLNRFYNDHILFGGGSTYSARASALKKITIPDDVDMYIDEFLIMAILLHGSSFLLREHLSVWREHRTNYSGAANTKEKKALKGERLLRSSAGMLRYVENNPFEDRIKRIYKLIDETRRMAYKEMTEDKKFGDILQYSKRVFLHIKPDWRLIKKYHVLNRLIPQSLYKMGKRILK